MSARFLPLFRGCLRSLDVNSTLIDRKPAKPTEPTPAQLEWIRGEQTALWRYLRLLGASDDAADDLVQDAFVVLLVDYPDLEPKARRGLLRTIAKNRFLDGRRGRRRHELLSWSEAVEVWLAERPAALDDDVAEQFDSCLAGLGERARTALHRHHVESAPLDKVAKELGLQRSGVRALLQRSRDALRTCLARRGFVAHRNHRNETV